MERREKVSACRAAGLLEDLLVSLFRVQFKHLEPLSWLWRIFSLWLLSFCPGVFKTTLSIIGKCVGLENESITLVMDTSVATCHTWKLLMWNWVPLQKDYERVWGWFLLCFSPE